MGGLTGRYAGTKIKTVTLDLNDSTDYLLAVLIGLEREHAKRSDGTYTNEGFVAGQVASKEIACYRYSKSALLAFDSLRTPCLSLEDALSKVPSIENETEIEPGYIKSGVWHVLFKQKTYFGLGYFDWTAMAGLWREMELLALSDELEPEMVDRFNEVVEIWTRM